MNRTIALLSSLLVTGACGGHVVDDGAGATSGAGGAGGDSTTTTTTGIEATVSSSSAGGGGPGTGAAGGSFPDAGSACDDASHTLDINDFNVSCKQASDCTPVFMGSFCSSCWCAWTAINASDLDKYKAEAQAKEAGTPGPLCFCPADVVSCVNGQCKGSL